MRSADEVQFHLFMSFVSRRFTQIRKPTYKLTTHYINGKIQHFTTKKKKKISGASYKHDIAYENSMTDQNHKGIKI